MGNTVLETTRTLLENPQYVHINDASIDKLAAEYSKEKLSIPQWNWSPYPTTFDIMKTIDFFMLTDTINFAFTNFHTGEKYIVNFNGKQYRGSEGMTAAIHKACNEGIPILYAPYLREISEKDMRHIFRGNVEIPMLKERMEIFHEVGEVLQNKYLGHFYNIVLASNHMCFNKGEGIVERLTRDFPSFDDSVMHKGKQIRFDKRAQLSVATLHGRFQGKNPLQIDDINELTIFADYQIPRGLRYLGVLEYEKSLAERIDSNILIEKNSLEELEIRASTIHAADRLLKRMNEYLPEGEKMTMPDLDYKLWKESRNCPQPHHLTITTAY